MEQQLTQEDLSEIERWCEPLILCTAAAKGELDKVRVLVEGKGYDPNGSDYDGRTPIHLASEEGHFEVVKYLVSRGANINCEDRWGTSPLRGAISFNRNDVAAYLKELGASVQYGDKKLLLASGEIALKEEEKIEEIRKFFLGLDLESNNGANIRVKAIEKALKTKGLSRKKNKLLDEQLKALETASGLEKIVGDKGRVSLQAFKELMAGPPNLLVRALEDNVAIPHWKSFCKEVEAIFDSCRDVDSGHNADYIPELAEADPNSWGLAIVTVDGQVLTLGDATKEFSIQSCGKPLQYSICAEEIGTQKIHEYVGQEPSGVAFNAFTLNSHKMPHNPFINSGAIMTSSLFNPHMNMSKRFKHLTQKISELAGGLKIGFSQSVYLSEKSVAHRNFALSHFMKAEGGFPPDVDILEAVDFYFQLCSCEVDCISLASIAATYANNGKSPLSNKKVLQSSTVKHTLQLMYSCGMYDFSGEWACTIGLPAKSGVSGSIFMVIPNVLGLALLSPRLDNHGNSVRGVEFCTRLVSKFNWNLFDILYNNNNRD